MPIDPLENMHDDMYNEFDLDLEGSNEPGSTAKQVSRTAVDLLTASGVGVVDGIKAQIRQNFPNSASLVDEAIETIDDFKQLKNDVSQEVGPAINTLREMTLRVMPMVKKFIPQKWHDSLRTRLEAGVTPPEPTAAEREATLREDTVRTATQEIFGTPSPKAETAPEPTASSTVPSKAEQELVHKEDSERLIDRRLKHVQFKASFDAMRKIHGSINVIADYMTTTYNSYLKKSLELKYQHLYLTQDIYRGILGIAKISEDRLKEIATNTSLPDSVKRTGENAPKQGAMAAASAGKVLSYNDYVNSFRKNLTGNIRKGLLGNIRTVTQMYLPMLDMLVAGLEFAVGDVGPMNVLKSITRFGSSFIGKHIAQKALNKNSWISQLTEDRTEFLKERVVNKAQAWGAKNINNPWLGWLAQLIPQYNKQLIKNSMIEGVTQEVPFDNTTRQTIVEVMPRHLERIGNFVEALYTKLAPEVPLNKQTYNIRQRKLTSLEEAREDLFTKEFGTTKTRAEGLERAIGSMQAILMANQGTRRNGEGAKDATARLQADQDHLKRFIVNSALAAKFFDPNEMLEFLRTGYPDNYISTVFEGIPDQDQKRVAQLLVDMVQDPRNGNKINTALSDRISNLIMRQNKQQTIQSSFATAAEEFGQSQLFEGIADYQKGIQTKGLYELFNPKYTEKTTLPYNPDTGKPYTPEEAQARGINLDTTSVLTEEARWQAARLRETLALEAKLRRRSKQKGRTEGSVIEQLDDLGLGGLAHVIPAPVNKGLTQVRDVVSGTYQNLKQKLSGGKLSGKFRNQIDDAKLRSHFRVPQVTRVTRQSATEFEILAQDLLGHHYREILKLTTPRSDYTLPQIELTELAKTKRWKLNPSDPSFEYRVIEPATASTPAEATSTEPISPGEPTETTSRPLPPVEATKTTEAKLPPPSISVKPAIYDQITRSSIIRIIPDKLDTIINVLKGKSTPLTGRTITPNKAEPSTSTKTKEVLATNEPISTPAEANVVSPVEAPTSTATEVKTPVGPNSERNIPVPEPTSTDYTKPRTNPVPNQPFVSTSKQVRSSKPVKSTLDDIVRVEIRVKADDKCDVGIDFSDGHFDTTQVTLEPISKDKPLPQQLDIKSITELAAKQIGCTNGTLKVIPQVLDVRPPQLRSPTFESIFSKEVTPSSKPLEPSNPTKPTVESEPVTTSRPTRVVADSTSKSKTVTTDRPTQVVTEPTKVTPTTDIPEITEEFEPTHPESKSVETERKAIKLTDCFPTKAELLDYIPKDMQPTVDKVFTNCLATKDDLIEFLTKLESQVNSSPAVNKLFNQLKEVAPLIKDKTTRKEIIGDILVKLSQSTSHITGDVNTRIQDIRDNLAEHLNRVTPKITETTTRLSPFKNVAQDVIKRQVDNFELDKIIPDNPKYETIINKTLIRPIEVTKPVFDKLTGKPITEIKPIPKSPVEVDQKPKAESVNPEVPDIKVEVFKDQPTTATPVATGISPQPVTEPKLDQTVRSSDNLSRSSIREADLPNLIRTITSKVVDTIKTQDARTISTGNRAPRTSSVDNEASSWINVNSPDLAPISGEAIPPPGVINKLKPEISPKKLKDVIFGTVKTTTTAKEIPDVGKRLGLDLVHSKIDDVYKLLKREYDERHRKEEAAEKAAKDKANRESAWDANEQAAANKERKGLLTAIKNIIKPKDQTATTTGTGGGSTSDSSKFGTGWLAGVATPYLRKAATWLGKQVWTGAKWTGKQAWAGAKTAGNYLSNTSWGKNTLTAIKNSGSTLGRWSRAAWEGFTKVGKWAIKGSTEKLLNRVLPELSKFAKSAPKLLEMIIKKVCPNVAKTIPHLVSTTSVVKLAKTVASKLVLVELAFIAWGVVRALFESTTAHDEYIKDLMQIWSSDSTSVVVGLSKFIAIQVIDAESAGHTIGAFIREGWEFIADIYRALTNQRRASKAEKALQAKAREVTATSTESTGTPATELMDATPAAVTATVAKADAAANVEDVTTPTNVKRYRKLTLPQPEVDTTETTGTPATELMDATPAAVTATVAKADAAANVEDVTTPTNVKRYRKLTLPQPEVDTTETTGTPATELMDATPAAVTATVAKADAAAKPPYPTQFKRKPTKAELYKNLNLKEKLEVTTPATKLDELSQTKPKTSTKPNTPNATNPTTESVLAENYLGQEVVNEEATRLTANQRAPQTTAVDQSAQELIAATNTGNQTLANKLDILIQLMSRQILVTSDSKVAAEELTAQANSATLDAAIEYAKAIGNQVEQNLLQPPPTAAPINVSKPAFA